MRFNRLKLAILSLLSASLLMLPALASGQASAFDLFGGVCGGKGSNSAVCQDAANKGGTNPVSGKGGILPAVINILGIVGGIAAVIMIIVSGMTMATSNGNTEHVQAARKRLIYAAVGLVVIAMSWSIVNYVINKLVSS